MVGRRRGIGVVLGLLMCLNTACYGFVPVTTGVAPKVGDEIQVRLNADGSAGMAPILGAGVVSAQGTLAQRNDDGSIVVGVVSVSLAEGVDRSWSGQNVATIPARFVEGVDVKTLDRSKTRAATIGGIAAIVAIFAIALSSGGVHGQPGSGGTQPPP